jgi:hypothetical protein
VPLSIEFRKRERAGLGSREEMIGVGSNRWGDSRGWTCHVTAFDVIAAAVLTGFLPDTAALPRIRKRGTCNQST